MEMLKTSSTQDITSSHEGSIPGSDSDVVPESKAPAAEPTSTALKSPLNRLAAIARQNSNHYTRLPSSDSIRVLELQPGKDDEPLSFSLRVVSDYRKAAHHALSYCWGDAVDCVSVLCNGRPILITQNLHSALCHLRSTDSARRLWVDAVCINQHDLAERSQQVSMMNEIYANALGVDVWLGPSDSHTSDAVALIENIATQCCAYKYGSRDRSEWVERLKQEDNLRDVMPEAALVGLPDVSSPLWNPLARYYDRAWFTRVWIIQEVQACPHVWLHCGDQVIEWEFVALVATWIILALWFEHTNELWNSKGVRQAVMLRERLVTREEVPFLVALNQARQFNATDPRDRVFSMLQRSIRPAREASPPHVQLPQSSNHENESSRLESSAKGAHLGIKTDYTMTTAEVYRTVALRSIEQHASLEVLSYALCTPASTYDHPSWIPRWDVDDYNARNIMALSLYDASGGVHPSISYSSTTTISLRGIALGSVAERLPVLQTDFGRMGNSSLPLSKVAGMDSKDWLVTLSRIITLDTGDGSSYNANRWKRVSEDVDSHVADFAAYLTSAIADGNSDIFIPFVFHYCEICGEASVEGGKGVPKVPYVYACDICDQGKFDICSSCYAAGKHCRVEGHELQPIKPMGIQYTANRETFAHLQALSASGVADRFARATWIDCYDRTFFTTDKGWIGLGSRLLQPTETIAVLYGGRAPFVLRAEGSQYRLLGPCYIHGFMDGDAVEMCRNGQLAEQTFELR